MGTVRQSVSLHRDGPVLMFRVPSGFAGPALISTQRGEPSDERDQFSMPSYLQLQVVTTRQAVVKLARYLSACFSSFNRITKHAVVW